MKRNAFSMLELVFVIIILGILAKFGTEFLFQAYENFVFSSTQNRLQAQSEAAVTQIAKRLQYRIRDSVIVRADPLNRNVGIGAIFPAPDGRAFMPLNDAALANPAINSDVRVIEWIGYDIDGWRGQWDAINNTNRPNWSGFIDLDAVEDKRGLYTNDANATLIISPQTNTALTGTTINALSGGDKNIANTALYFIGANSDIFTGYGWDGTVATEQNTTMHPITSDAADNTVFIPAVGSFAGQDVYENYRLAWSAYAVYFEDPDNDCVGDLFLYYDYQPWNGQTFAANGTRVLLAENVHSFRFRSIGDIIKLQVCTTDANVYQVACPAVNNDPGYAICKEKTIF